MSNRPIVIRNAEQSEFESVLKLLLHAYAEYELLLPKDRWEQYQVNIVESITDVNVKARIVAEINGEIVGSVFIYASSEEAYGLPELNINNPILRLLAVRPDLRGQGIATELIRASVTRSIYWGAHTLHLHTNEAMSSAVRLYEHLGFERAHDKDIYKDDDSVVKSYRLDLKRTPLLQT